MTRLIGLGLVATLGRTVGGARAGSAGHIYTLTPTGHRTLAIADGQPCPPRTRPPRTPSTLFLAHTLAISDIYVSLHEASRDQDCQISIFTTEPQCWWPTGGGNYLKPDAYLMLSTTTHADCWWLEVDQTTEPLPRIRTKCHTYLDYLTHGGLGPDHVPPRVVFTVPDTERRNAIQKVIDTLSEHCGQMICVTTHADAATLLATELHTP